jgi:hypothetical protein
VCVCVCLSVCLCVVAFPGAVTFFRLEVRYPELRVFPKNQGVFYWLIVVFTEQPKVFFSSPKVQVIHIRYWPSFFVLIVVYFIDQQSIFTRYEYQVPGQQKHLFCKCYSAAVQVPGTWYPIFLACTTHCVFCGRSTSFIF